MRFSNSAVLMDDSCWSHSVHFNTTLAAVPVTGSLISTTSKKFHHAAEVLLLLGFSAESLRFTRPVCAAPELLDAYEAAPSLCSLLCVLDMLQHLLGPPQPVSCCFHLQRSNSRLSHGSRVRFSCTVGKCVRNSPFRHVQRIYERIYAYPYNVGIRT